MTNTEPWDYLVVNFINAAGQPRWEENGRLASHSWTNEADMLLYYGSKGWELVAVGTSPALPARSFLAPAWYFKKRVFGR